MKGRTGKQLLDPWTAVLVATMVAGTVVVVVLHANGMLPAFAAWVLGTFLMNLSFTAWHEPAHGIFSSSRKINTLAGWIASCASVYPGYFARRREHLIHHKWEGQSGKDPVYPRIQATFWEFPWNLLKLTLRPPSLAIPDSFLPVTRSQKIADGFSHAVVAAIFLSGVVFGYWESLLIGWILPRGTVFWIHAYTICFFPHRVVGGGYEVHRVAPSRILTWLTVGQNLHGVHHKQPSAAWHEYGRLPSGGGGDIRGARCPY